MKKKGLFILLITIIGFVGYFGYKKYLQLNNPKSFLISSSSPDNDVTGKNFDGHYVHCSLNNACNYVNIKFLSNEKATIETEAYWTGPGDEKLYKISGEIIVKNSRSLLESKECKVDIFFEKNMIILLQQSWKDCGGASQSFDGIYIKK